MSAKSEVAGLWRAASLGQACCLPLFKSLNMSLLEQNKNEKQLKEKLCTFTNQHVLSRFRRLTCYSLVILQMQNLQEQLAGSCDGVAFPNRHPDAPDCPMSSDGPPARSLFAAVPSVLRAAQRHVA